jgi:hypothetical protein
MSLDTFVYTYCCNGFCLIGSSLENACIVAFSSGTPSVVVGTTVSPSVVDLGLQSLKSCHVYCRLFVV